MARLFARLKLRLLAGGLRRSGRFVGFVLAVLLVGPLVLGACVGLVVLGRHDPAAARSVATIVCALLLLAWALLPAFAFGLDETLDPARLALLPLSGRQLVTGLLAAAAVGLPALGTLALAASALAATAEGVVSVLVALLAAALVVVLCLALSRAITSALSGLLRSRRGRDLAVLAAGLSAIAVQAVNLYVQRLLGSADAQTLRAAAQALGWLPSTLAVAATTAAGEGRAGAALLLLALLAGSALLVLLAWHAALVHALTTVDAAGRGGRNRAERGGRRRWERLLPGGRVGAVAGKELRYVWRDPRRKSQWVGSLVFGLAGPLLLVFSFDLPAAWAVPSAVVAAAFFLSAATLNSLGLDGPALWQHVLATATPADLRRDLAGRNLAVALAGVPVLLVVAVAAAALLGVLPVAAAAAGLGCAVLGAGLGVGNLVSVWMPYRVPDDSSSVLAGPGAGQGCLALLSVLGAFLAVGALTAPLLAVATVTGADGAAAGALLLAGPPYGLLLAAAGGRLAAAYALPRLPELLETLTRPA